ncbi:UDP-glycosyltransferase 76C2-like [Amaranthus tricolor]|uniref:UDP-glycosyltransferase 76C2-like n=1 Tax=Amaranthus tricolor TaxID=29722 RepID=UPI002590DB2A|nr:UDP-glycosyltransferase 76C2-like [Amaranthus tricolor]
MQQENMGVRLLLFPLPLQGHAIPMFHLANLLQKKGFLITIVQTRYNSPDPNNFPLFTFHFLEDGLPANATPAPNDYSTVLSVLNTNCLTPFYNCLSQILCKAAKDQEPIACLIADPMWSFAGSVSSRLKLPRITLRSTSMSAYFVYHSLPSLRDKGYYPLQETKFDELVPELPPLKVKDLPPEAGQDLLADTVKETNTSQGIIWNTFEELEDAYITRVRQVLSIPIFPIGPIHKYSQQSPVNIWAQDQTSISWLNKQAPHSVLYVSFGSIAAVSKADFIEIARGLANSKQAFLWVVRHGLIEGSNENNPLPLPNGYLDMIGQRGHIVNWAPQQEVLAHPAVGGFWTHCGWNSIMESISEGVPMLCLPCFADQTMNMRHVCDNWKIGLQLEKGLKSEEIERAVKKLLVEEEGAALRNRIKALKEKATLSLKEGGSSYKSLEDLTNYLLSL